jgi:hypothetical protein
MPASNKRKRGKLFRFFHHEHFNGPVRGHEFKAKSVKRLVHLIPIAILQVGLTAMQIKREGGCWLEGAEMQCGTHLLPDQAPA